MNSNHLAPIVIVSNNNLETLNFIWQNNLIKLNLNNKSIYMVNRHPGQEGEKNGKKLRTKQKIQYLFFFKRKIQLG